MCFAALMYLCVTRALDECDPEMEVGMLSPLQKKKEKKKLALPVGFTITSYRC